MVDAVPTPESVEEDEGPLQMPVLAYLLRLRPALPQSIEQPPSVFEPGELNPSNGEVRRWLKNKAVWINGAAVDDKFVVTFPVTSLIFFPKRKRRTMLI